MKRRSRSGKPTAGVRGSHARSPALDPESTFFSPDAYVRAGGNINARNSDGQTVLMLQKYAQPSMIRRIIELGANVHAKDNNGHPTLMYFLGAGHDHLAPLLKAGASVKAFERTQGSSVLWALADGRCDGETIRLLLAHGARRPVNRRHGYNAWHMAATHSCGNAFFRRRTHEIIQELAALELPIDARDKKLRTPLWIAIEQHVVECDRIKGWEDGSFAPMHGVVYFYKYHETVELLLRHGADPNAALDQSPHALIPAGGTPLMVRRYDQLDLHAALLKHGADPLARCAKGKSARDYASECAASRRYDREGAAKVVIMLQRAERNAARGRNKGR